MKSAAVFRWSGQAELLRQLERMAVERRPEVCFGCGLEHNCARDGCAALLKAAELLRQ